MCYYGNGEKKQHKCENEPSRERDGFSATDFFFVSFESCASEIPPHKRKGNMFIRGKSLYKMLLFGKWNLTFLNQNAMCLFTFLCIHLFENVGGFKGRYLLCWYSYTAYTVISIPMAYIWTLNKIALGCRHHFQSWHSSDYTNLQLFCSWVLLD